jgi:hypothetical protein
LKELQQKHQLNSAIIGMEPTGHYWFNLANWLSNKEDKRSNGESGNYQKKQGEPR